MTHRTTDGSINSQPDNEGIDATQGTQNDPGRSGEATRVERPVSNDNYTRQSHKSTERAHRTGLRTTTQHASWRQVYAACHVGVGVDE